jgi:hypothetical protein
MRDSDGMLPLADLRRLHLLDPRPRVLGGGFRTLDLRVLHLGHWLLLGQNRRHLHDDVLWDLLLLHRDVHGRGNGTGFCSTERPKDGGQCST